MSQLIRLFPNKEPFISSINKKLWNTNYVPCIVSCVGDPVKFQLSILPLASRVPSSPPPSPKSPTSLAQLLIPNLRIVTLINLSQ